MMMCKESELNLPNRFKGFALPVVTTEGRTVIKTALLNDIIQALSDARNELHKKDCIIGDLVKDKSHRIQELESLHPFIKYMVNEIEANKEKKGVWQEWKPEDYTEWTKEIAYHVEKLNLAFKNNKPELILELCADIANLAYFTAVNSEALQGKAK